MKLDVFLWRISHPKLWFCRNRCKHIPKNTEYCFQIDERGFCRCPFLVQESGQKDLCAYKGVELVRSFQKICEIK